MASALDGRARSGVAVGADGDGRRDIGQRTSPRVAPLVAMSRARWLRADNDAVATGIGAGRAIGLGCLGAERRSGSNGGGSQRSKDGPDTSRWHVSDLTAGESYPYGGGMPPGF